MTMPKIWYRKLLDVMFIQSNSENEKLMVLFLVKELDKLGVDWMIDAAGNILVVKGKDETYPCIVSHMDTVHNFEYPFSLYRKQKDGKDADMLFAKSNDARVGIGGDDKCGVFACLCFLKVLPVVKVVFFSREEAGCKGSSQINLNFFSNCRYILQLDRKGTSDLIQDYWGDTTISKEFSSEIGASKKQYGFKKAKGTVTDCMKLWKRKVNLSCINISAGYSQPHSNLENISISALWNSVKFTHSIIKVLKNKPYPCLPPKPKPITAITTTAGSYTNWNGRKRCADCYRYVRKYLLYNYIDKDNKKREVCLPCKLLYNNRLDEETKRNDSTSTHISHCTECGNKIKIWTYASKLYKDGRILCIVCATTYDKLQTYLQATTNKIKWQCEECKRNLKAKRHIPTMIKGKLYCLECVDYLHANNGEIFHDLKWYCPACKTALSDTETEIVVDGELTNRCCATCNTDVYSMDDIPDSNNIIQCYKCMKPIPKHDPFISKGGKRICGECAGVRIIKSDNDDTENNTD